MLQKFIKIICFLLKWKWDGKEMSEEGYEMVGDS